MEKQAVAMQYDWAARWPLHSVNLRDSLKVSAHAAPWTDFPKVKMQGLSERQKDLLNCGMLATKKKFPRLPISILRKGLWCDVSQGHSRKPWFDKLATLCTSTVLYSYEKDATMSGHGHLLLVGHSPQCAPASKFSEAECRDLAGESYSAPWIHAIVLSMFASMHH